MGKRKLTESVVQQIRAARDNGATHSDLAARFKVSKGSVFNALATPAPARGKRAPGPASVGAVEIQTGGPPTYEDLRGWLGEHVRGLRADLEALKAEAAEPSAIAAAARNLTAASTLLSRVTPQPPPPADPNEIPDLVAAAEATKKRMRAWLARRAAEAATRPPCPSCGRPLPAGRVERGGP